MKINLAKSAGFCFGVKRAIEIAVKTAKSGRNVYMMGDIVHNGEVAGRIRALGVKKVVRLKPGKDRILLIRAHGVGEKAIHEARKLGYEIIDATCPMVKEIHRIVKGASARGREIIVIGDKDHDEVRGIVGQIEKKVLVLDPGRKFPFQSIRKIKRASVVAQSTQDVAKVARIFEMLKGLIRNIEFFNTVCRPTRIKQEEIRSMPRKNDLMIIIGSRKSANTKRLYRISKAINNRTYWVNSEKDIKHGWLKGAASVGVTAGASTPEGTIEKIVSHLKKFA